MANHEHLLAQWRREEELAYMHGWDFSHIHGRYEEEQDLPWDYEQVLRSYLTPEKRLLDLDTGGGEFLLSLNHPRHNTGATEGYPPNVRLCQERLLPLVIDFREADPEVSLPFPDESYDLIINRHGGFHAVEIDRVLKPGGIFLTEQVGARNDRDLVELLLSPAPPLPYPDLFLDKTREIFEKAGFSILRGEEAFRPIRFYDVGALVWFARVLPWEFPGFSVDGCRNRLFHTQEILEQKGVIRGTIHRFLLAAQKPVSQSHF